MDGKAECTIGSTIGEHKSLGQHKLPQLSSDKKRKSEDISVTVDVEDNDKENQASNDWQKLFHALQAQRETKAEALLYEYVRESEERERLMRTYNQELENANQQLRAAQSNSNEKEREQELQNQVQALQAKVAHQDATIRAYQQLTGTTLSNIRVPTILQSETNSGDPTTGLVNTNSNTAETNANKSTLDCVCTVENPETKVKTKFRISAVSPVLTGDEEDDKEAEALSFLKYESLENNEPLPDFLRAEIEFESTQLPQLLQNVLRGIFPEEEEEGE
jgi:hypothetical protein